MTLSADPVAEGVAASLARPGGNLTGLSTLSAQLSQKHLEILSAVLPKLSRVAALVNSVNVANLTQWQHLQAAAKTAAIELVRADAQTPAEIERGARATGRADRPGRRAFRPAKAPDRAARIEPSPADDRSQQRAPRRGA
jgi:putative ABC transport system substrate-binding protein